MSLIYTKQELTEYLSTKLSQHLVKDYAVVYRQTILTNMIDLNQNLHIYNHEKADTEIIPHTLDISKRDSFTELVIFCSDTDVLLILLYYFEELSSCAVFKTTNKSYVPRKIHENPTPLVCL